MHWAFLIFVFIVTQRVHAKDQSWKSQPAFDLANIADDAFFEQLNQAPKSLHSDLERKWIQLQPSFLNQSNTIIHQVSLSIIHKSHDPILQNDHIRKLASEAVSNTIQSVTGNFSKFFHMAFDHQPSQLSKRDIHYRRRLTNSEDFITNQWLLEFNSLLEEEKDAYHALISYLKTKDPEYATAIEHSDRALETLSTVLETEKLVAMARDLREAGYHKIIMFQSFMATSKEYFEAAMEFIRSQDFVERRSQEVIEDARKRSSDILKMDFFSQKHYSEARVANGLHLLEAYDELKRKIEIHTMHVTHLDASSDDYHIFLRRIQSLPRTYAQTIFDYYQHHIANSERYRNLLNAYGETHLKLLEIARQWGMHEDAQYLREQIARISEKSAWISETVIKNSQKISQGMLKVMGVEHPVAAGAGLKNGLEHASMDHVFQEMAAHLRHARVVKRTLPPGRNSGAGTLIFKKNSATGTLPFKLLERPIVDALRLKGAGILQAYYSSILRKHQASLGIIF